ncbi:MAG TPA: hypothetical protein VGH37_12520 [Candidatus Acidoferrum sp.]|jgi:hypothetical protein
MTCGVRQRSVRDGLHTGVSVAFCVVLAGFSGLITPRLAASQAPAAISSDIIFVQATQITEDANGLSFPEGSRIVRLAGNRKLTSGQPVSLTEGFFAAADPQISFDASKVLFSGKKNGSEPWQIWEMQADGNGKRQITNCTEDCRLAAYLPGEEIIFTVSGDRAKGESSYLAVAKMDGSQIRRVTFGPGDWRLETVLRDGRIVASASWPLTVSNEPSKNRLLYTLRPDGSALDALRCDHQGTAMRGEAAELQDGTIVYVKNSSATRINGRLTEIQKGEVHERSVGFVSGGLRFPHELADGRLIVAHRGIAAGGNEKFDLYVFDLQKNIIGEKIYSDAHLNSLQAIPVLAHVVPKKFWSTLSAESKSGYFIALDSYASGEEASGRIDIPIASVRVWTLPVGSTKEEILGEAPVEKDGSFYVEVAANQPVRFELLNANGSVIRSEHSWIWSRPGEQRGCAGCHSDKAVAPENRWPMTLKRFDTPTRFGQNQRASRDVHAD